MTRSQVGNQLSEQLWKTTAPEMIMKIPVMKMMMRMTKMEMQEEVTSSSFCLEMILDICLSLMDCWGLCMTVWSVKVSVYTTHLNIQDQIIKQNNNKTQPPASFRYEDIPLRASAFLHIYSLHTVVICNNNFEENIRPEYNSSMMSEANWWKKFDWIYEIFIRFLQANRWWLDFSFNYLNVATSINSASIFDETSFSVAISLWKHEKQDFNVKQQVKESKYFQWFSNVLQPWQTWD